MKPKSFDKPRRTSQRALRARYAAAWLLICTAPAGALDFERIDGTRIPVRETHEFSRVKANEWYADDMCEHVADLRVRALAALSAWDDYKSLAYVIDQEVPQAGGDAFIVNAYGWLQEPEERATLWRPFAEIEVMKCGLNRDEGAELTIAQLIDQIRQSDLIFNFPKATYSDNVVDIDLTFPERSAEIVEDPDFLEFNMKYEGCRTWKRHLIANPRLIVRQTLRRPDRSILAQAEISDEWCSEVAYWKPLPVKTP